MSQKLHGHPQQIGFSFSLMFHILMHFAYCSVCWSWSLRELMDLFLISNFIYSISDLRALSSKRIITNASVILYVQGPYFWWVSTTWRELTGYFFSFPNVWFLFFRPYHNGFTSQPAFTCSKLAIETLEQGVKYVKS